ncbi:hypothetical protein Bpfe_031132 [Biomphalaria pfeifferi]|uniref:Uncharacterized protein n=1 Tax=Biomphalaria pfeifferi TaxID=112525 RepID=A0AAD8ETK8_BIOPF|nr:hypothetical protein Bpfe_031132 [Biomphalaria pfeifferi]
MFLSAELHLPAVILHSFPMLANLPQQGGAGEYLLTSPVNLFGTPGEIEYHRGEDHLKVNGQHHKGVSILLLPKVLQEAFADLLSRLRNDPIDHVAGVNLQWYIRIHS